MKRLLADIRALHRAYYADHTVVGDVLDVLVTMIATAGIIAHAFNLVDLWERHHG